MKKIILVFLVLLSLDAAIFSQKNADWKWRISLKGDFRSVVSDEDKIFISESKGNIKAFNINAGKLIWENKTVGGQDFYVLSLFQNYLVAHNADKNFVSVLDAQNGKIIWTAKPQTELIFVQPDTRGNLFISSADGLTAYNLQTGKEKWTNADCENLCRVDFVGNFLVRFGSGSAQILSPENGKVLAGVKRHGNFNYLGENGDSIFFIFTGWEKKIIYSFNKISNKLVKTGELNNRDDFVGNIEGNNFYFAYLNEATVSAADLANGNLNWTFEDESEETRFRTFLTDKDFLYAGTDNGFLYVFKKNDGKLIWKKKYSGSELNVNFISDGFGFLTTQNKIVKINLQDGKPVWTFAAFGAVADLKQTNGTLYFSTLEGSYNAVDLKKIDRLSRTKRQFGTLTPSKEFLNMDTPVLSIGGSGGGFPVNPKKFSDVSFAENKAYFSITDESAKQSLFYQLDLSNGKYRTGEKIKAVNPTESFIYKDKAYFNDLPKRGYDETDSSLIAVDLNTGKPSYLRTKASFSKSPVVVNDVIYVAGANRLFHGFDLEGNSVLNGNFDNGLSLDRFIFVGDENEIYLRTDQKTFSAYKHKELLWSFQSKGQSLTSFSDPFGDEILISAAAGNLYKLDKQTGAIKWQKDYSDDLIYFIEPQNDKAFVLSEAAFTYWLQAVSLADGSTVWDRNLDHFYGKPVLWEDNICVQTDSRFQCFNQNSGVKTFSHRSENAFYGFSPNGILLYQLKNSDDKTEAGLQAVDLKTGREFWKIKL